MEEQDLVAWFQGLSPLYKTLAVGSGVALVGGLGYLVWRNVFENDAATQFLREYQPLPYRFEDGPCLFSPFFVAQRLATVTIDEGTVLLALKRITRQNHPELFISIQTDLAAHYIACQRVNDACNCFKRICKCIQRQNSLDKTGKWAVGYIKCLLNLLYAQAQAGNEQYKKETTDVVEGEESTAIARLMKELEIDEHKKQENSENENENEKGEKEAEKEATRNEATEEEDEAKKERRWRSGMPRVLYHSILAAAVSGLSPDLQETFELYEKYMKHMLPKDITRHTADELEAERMFYSLWSILRHNANDLRGSCDLLRKAIKFSIACPGLNKVMPDLLQKHIEYSRTLDEVEIAIQYQEEYAAHCYEVFTTSKVTLTGGNPVTRRILLTEMQTHCLSVWRVLGVLLMVQRITVGGTDKTREIECALRMRELSAEWE